MITLELRPHRKWRREENLLEMGKVDSPNVLPYVTHGLTPHLPPEPLRKQETTMSDHGWQRPLRW